MAAARGNASLRNRLFQFYFPTYFDVGMMYIAFSSCGALHFKELIVLGTSESNPAFSEFSLEVIFL